MIPNADCGAKLVERVKLVLLMFACLGSFQVPRVSAQGDLVEFRELVLDEPATSLTMTEDGKQLLLTHQAAHFVSVYDVLSKKVTATVPCLSPRSIISRGNEAYVVNFGESTISILSREKGWSKVNDVKLPKVNIEHIAAARAESFDRQLFVTCRGAGANENLIYIVNIDQDSSTELGKSSLAEVSADGRLVMLESLNRDDGYGGLAAFNTKEFSDPKAAREPVFRGGTGQTPYIYQHIPGSYWLSQRDIFGGVPIARLHHEPEGFIVPDRSNKLFYVLNSDVIKCARLNTAFGEVASRRVRYPSRFKDFGMINQHVNRMCDQPCAYVHGDRLHLFVITAQGAAILAAETLAFGD